MRQECRSAAWRRPSRAWVGESSVRGCRRAFPLRCSRGKSCRRGLLRPESLDRGMRSPSRGVVIGEQRRTVRTSKAACVRPPGRGSGDLDMRQEHLPGDTCSTGATATGTRSNALWGKKRRRFPLLVFTFVVVAASVLAGSTAAGPPPPSSGVVPDSLRDKAKAHPADTFNVVIQTTDASQLDALGATVRDAQKQHPGKARGPDEEVQADRQRDGGGHGRPDLRHRRGAGRRQRDGGRADPGDLLRQPAELARERRCAVGRPTEKGGVPQNRDRRLGRRDTRRLRQTNHPAGRPHDHGRELLG